LIRRAKAGYAAVPFHADEADSAHDYGADHASGAVDDAAHFRIATTIAATAMAIAMFATISA